jgi:SAM-dependent methyltransferase
MSHVPEVAARGFDATADQYERFRPGYPPDAIGWLVASCRIGPTATVCDLGAGTGKVTRLLTPTGASVLAVEPLDGMVTVLRRELPEVPAAVGVAEAMPLADGSCTAITAGQALHWFDLDRALPELQRVLEPSGRLGLLWNGWDNSVGWVHEVREIVANAGASEQWLKGHLGDEWLHDAFDATPAFGALHQQTFRHEVEADPASVVERIATTSHIAMKPVAERDDVLAAVRAAVEAGADDAGKLRFPYKVDAYWSERTADRVSDNAQ